MLSATGTKRVIGVLGASKFGLDAFKVDIRHDEMRISYRFKPAFHFLVTPGQTSEGQMDPNHNRFGEARFWIWCAPGRVLQGGEVIPSTPYSGLIDMLAEWLENLGNELRPNRTNQDDRLNWAKEQFAQLLRECIPDDDTHFSIPELEMVKQTLDKLKEGFERIAKRLELSEEEVKRLRADLDALTKRATSDASELPKNVWLGKLVAALAEMLLRNLARTNLSELGDIVRGLLGSGGTG